MKIERYFSVFEHPMALAVLVHVVPPPEADEQTAGYVLDCPEVNGQACDDHDEDCYEVGEENGSE
jgi:hypothetical protein